MSCKEGTVMGDKQYFSFHKYLLANRIVIKKTISLNTCVLYRNDHFFWSSMHEFKTHHTNASKQLAVNSREKQLSVRSNLHTATIDS